MTLDGFVDRDRAGDPADHRLGRVHPDRHLDRFAVETLRVLRRLLHGHRRESRAHRRVFHRVQTERGDDARRAQLFDAAAEALDLFDQHLEPVSDIGDKIGGRLRERGAEQRDVPPFPPGEDDGAHRVRLDRR